MVLTLLFLCATASVLGAGTIPTSIEVRCDQDMSCRDTFKEYVRKAIEDSGTHVVVDDTAKPTLRIMLWIAKNTEGDVTRGDAISRPPGFPFVIGSRPGGLVWASEFGSVWKHQSIRVFAVVAEIGENARWVATRSSSRSAIYRSDRRRRSKARCGCLRTTAGGRRGIRSSTRRPNGAADESYPRARSRAAASRASRRRRQRCRTCDPRRRR